MPEPKESFPVWLMHAVDRMLMPKDKKPDREKLLARRLAAEEAMKQTPLEEPDDIAIQVARLKRRNEIMAKAVPEELWNK
jgi:hypothetical protein